MEAEEAAGAQLDEGPAPYRQIGHLKQKENDIYTSRREMCY